MMERGTLEQMERLGTGLFPLNYIMPEPRQGSWSGTVILQKWPPGPQRALGQQQGLEKCSNSKQRVLTCEWR